MTCNGICIDSSDIGVPGYGIAYPHPGCPEHGDPEATDPLFWVEGRGPCPDCRHRRLPGRVEWRNTKSLCDEGDVTSVCTCGHWCHWGEL